MLGEADLKISNITCVHCQKEVPYGKIFFKGLANRRVKCPSCHTTQYIALRALIFEYIFLVTGILLIFLNTNYFHELFLYTIAIIIFLSSFIFAPFKKLVATR